jgi:hypothetical protein
MSAKTGRLLTRRRFLGRLALFASLTSASRYGESLWTDEPTSDPLGQTLPRRLLGRTEEKVTMLGLGWFPRWKSQRPRGAGDDRSRHRGRNSVL